MYGYWYSVKENFSFERTEVIEVLWTAFAFAFIQALRMPGETFRPEIALTRLIIFLILVSIAILAHVSLQKLVAIKLGYKAKYTFWLNGLLISVFLAIIFLPIADVFKLKSTYSVGFLLILPGAVTIEHIPRLRLGKFRYGTNLKDLARISLAGPMAHVILVMIVGGLFFISGNHNLLSAFISVNLLLAAYSMLPIPKIDSPSKMDSGTDGLGMFFFSRTLYVLVLTTILVFSMLTFTSITTVGAGWLFIVALSIGCILAFFYSVSLDQKN